MPDLPWHCRSQASPEFRLGGDGAEPGPGGLCGGGRGALLATVGEERARIEGDEPRYRLSPATGLAAGRGGDGVARHGIDLDAHAELCDSWRASRESTAGAWSESMGRPLPEKPSDIAAYLAEILDGQALSNWA